MNIFGHILPNHAVLGIGPIMVEYNSNSMYGERKRYYFDLHLTAHTTVVKSEWFSTNANDEQWKAWRENHTKLQDKISVIIGEPTESRKLFEEEVQRVHEQSAHIIEDLTAQVQPLSAGQSLKFQRLLDNILELSTLALK